MVDKFLFLLFIQFGTIYFQNSAANPLSGEIYPASKGEFPFVVYLNLLKNPINKKNHFCGGALISKRHVLTSRHCIEHYDRTAVGVVVGSIDFSGGQVHTIESWMTYDVWTIIKDITEKFVDNDIAILTLSKEVKDIHPAVISQLHDKQVIGKKVVTAGWGYIHSDKKMEPDTLQKAYMNVLDSKTYTYNWEKLYGINRKPVPNYYYTFAKPQALLCHGDSGGPLMLASSKEIIGINDSGCINVKNPVNNPHIMSRHLIIDYYRDFIDEVLER